MRVDITIEFYHKEAVYNSKITGAKQPIKIKEVFVDIVPDMRDDTIKKCYCIIVSTTGNTYLLNELTFPKP